VWPRAPDDELRIRQQRECVCIASPCDRRKPVLASSPFEAHRLHFEEGGNNATEESIIPESRPFEGVNGLTFVLPVDLRVVTVESPTSLTLTVVLPVDTRVDSNDASAETV